MAYIHENSIAHCDLKFENILYDPRTKNLKIIDFGFAVFNPETTEQDFVCGTPTYMCPLAIKKLEHDKFKADVWALGVILFKLATGIFPFRSKRESELNKKITRGDYSFPASLKIDSSIRELVSRMLKVREGDRIDLADVVQNGWMDFCG